MVVPLTISLLAGLGACPPGEAPGIVVVVGGDLQPVTFPLPTGIDYQLSYDAARLALWFDPAQTLPALPLTTFQSTGQVVIVHGDLNGDGSIDGTDFKIFVAVVLGVNTNPIVIAQADFDESGVADVSDAPLFVDALLAPGSSQNTGIILYAEGLTASTDLCDTQVDLLTDPQGAGTFALADTAQLTVADLTINPQTGGLGTPVTITLAPAIAPLVFDAATTATWAGAYQPIVGLPSAPFTITYSASEFRESSVNEAVLIVGDGTTVGACPETQHSPGGTLVGNILIDLGSLSLTLPLSFTPNTSGDFHTLLYPEDETGLLPDTPDIGPVADPLFAIHVLPGETSGLFLETPGGFHYAYAVTVVEDSITSSVAPASITVTLISADSMGNEVDRLEGLILSPLLNDGDPATITYSSDRDTAIVLVDAPVVKEDFPLISILQIAILGQVFVVPCTN